MNPQPYTYVYALFDIEGVCQYVGISRDPKARFSVHRSVTLPKQRLSMRIIRRVSDADSLRIEAQVACAYRRLGQARLNRQLNVTNMAGGTMRRIRMPKNGTLPEVSRPTKYPELLRVRIPESLKSRITTVSERRCCSESDIVREAFIRFIDAEEIRLGINHSASSTN